VPTFAKLPCSPLVPSPDFVIASEAKQWAAAPGSGLLRGFAPRHDDSGEMIARDEPNTCTVAGLDYARPVSPDFARDERESERFVEIRGAMNPKTDAA
jgi:hypothetical protein